MPKAIELSDKFTHSTGVRQPELLVPLSRPRIELLCVHTRVLEMSVTNDFDDDEFRGVITMHDPDQAKGVYGAFPAERCRIMAQALLDMADDIDRRNSEG